MEAPIEALVQRYIALRDKKAQLKKQFEEKTSVLDEAMTKVEVYLLSQLQSQGVESFKTSAGTAYTSHRVSVSVADREAYLKYLSDNDLWHMLDVKANKPAVEQFKQENQDLPPGVNYRDEIVVNVRRS